MADTNELERTVGALRSEVTALRQVLKLLLVEHGIESPTALRGMSELAGVALRGKDALRADVGRLIEEARALLDAVKTGEELA